MLKLDEENRSRSQGWEDESPEEPRFRRPRPGMSAKSDDAEEPMEAGWAKSRSGFEEPERRWWSLRGSLGRWLIFLAVAVIVTALSVAAYLVRNLLFTDDRFRIAGTQNIEVSGLGEVNRADVLPVFGEDIGRNIFKISLSDRRRQLEQIPWIERATVMRLLPDHIRVSVVERQPVAFARSGATIQLVDANGVLLAMPPELMAQHHYSFPVVTGIDPADPAPSRKARMSVFTRMMDELDSSSQKISHQISEVDLTNPENARVTMQDDPVVLNFGSEKFLERYQRYQTQIIVLKQQYPHISGVDLRYDRIAVLEQTTPAPPPMAVVNADQTAPPAATPAAPPAPRPEAKAAKEPKKDPHAGAAKAALGKGKSGHPAPVSKAEEKHREALRLHAEANARKGAKADARPGHHAELKKPGKVQPTAKGKATAKPAAKASTAASATPVATERQAHSFRPAGHHNTQGTQAP